MSFKKAWFPNAESSDLLMPALVCLAPRINCIRVGAALGQKGPIPLPPALHRIRIPQFVTGKSVLKPSNESPGTDAGRDQVGTGLDDACQQRRGGVAPHSVSS